jgi:hypothetical protein
VVDHFLTTRPLSDQVDLGSEQQEDARRGCGGEEEEEEGGQQEKRRMKCREEGEGRGRGGE